MKKTDNYTSPKSMQSESENSQVTTGTKLNDKLKLEIIAGVLVSIILIMLIPTYGYVAHLISDTVRDISQFVQTEYFLVAVSGILFGGYIDTSLYYACYLYDYDEEHRKYKLLRSFNQENPKLKVSIMIMVLVIMVIIMFYMKLSASEWFVFIIASVISSMLFALVIDICEEKLMTIKS